MHSTPFTTFAIFNMSHQLVLEYILQVLVLQAQIDWHLLLLPLTGTGRQPV